MTRRILVTAANGDIAEAIAGIVREAFPDAELHGVDANGYWPAAALFDTVETVPMAADPEYPRVLSAIAKNVGATLVIPCNEAELLRLATDPGPAAGLPLLMVDGDLVRTFCDKLETQRWLSRNTIRSPWTAPLTAARPEHLPIIAKPRRSAGSHGVCFIGTADHLRGVQDEYGDRYIAQAFLPHDDQERTCALIRVNGVVRSLTMRRKLDAGRTVAATVEDRPDITGLLARLAEAARLEGAINVQLRVTTDGPMIFEINPRFSSTVKMRHMLGFQDLVWLINSRDGAPLPAFRPQVGASVYRLSREVLGASATARQIQRHDSTA